MNKEDLRRYIRLQKRLFSPQQLEELSLPIVSRLRNRLAGAKVVFAYYSLPDEVNTHQLVDDLLADGKTVFLPKVIDGERMTWHRYTGTESLREGALHIMEPDSSAEDLDIENYLSQASDTMLVVPGLAFDAKGQRLGRGRGYYDRFLIAHPILYKIGVCFDFQKVDEVPTDANDVPIDEVI